MSYSDLPGLNAYIADKSYIEGYAFSPKDVEVFSQFALPDAASYPHAYRWYIHIAALSGIPASLAYASAAGSAPAAAAPSSGKAAAQGGDDDDFDVFGDDDDDEEEEKAPTMSRAEKAAALKKERDAELEKAKQAALERLAKKEAKQRTLCNLEITPWEADQDLIALHKKLKETVVREGLKWSEGCKLVDVGYGIKKMVLTAVLSMNLSMDALIEEIADEDEGILKDEIQSFTMTSMSLL